MRTGAIAIAAAWAALAAGCGSRQPVEQATVVARHEHHAPHDGTLVEMGDEFAHVELLFDRAEGRLTAYVLDGEAEHPIRLPDRALNVVIDGVPAFANRPAILGGVADVLTGETLDSTSQFTLVDPALRQVASISGRIPSLTVKGTLFKDLTFQVPASGG